MNIVTCDPVGQSGIELLKKLGHVITTDVSQADVLIVRSRTKVTKELIDSAPKLKIIARAGSGTDTIDVAYAQSKGIRVINAPGANAQSVAEHTIALMLSLSRDIVNTSIVLKQGKWTKSTYRGFELCGKTLGIVGFGHVGKHVAEIATAIGMNVTVFSRSRQDAPLRELLEKSDVVSLHVSLSKETEGMLGKSEFALMKPTAVLINTSRGSVIDEMALIDALQQNTIAGAALDVYNNEPLDPTSPLCRLPNVILTPHVASVSPESEENASMMIASEIDRILKGESI